MTFLLWQGDALLAKLQARQFFHNPTFNFRKLKLYKVVRLVAWSAVLFAKHSLPEASIFEGLWMYQSASGEVLLEFFFFYFFSYVCWDYKKKLQKSLWNVYFGWYEEKQQENNEMGIAKKEPGHIYSIYFYLIIFLLPCSQSLSTHSPGLSFLWRTCREQAVIGA